MSNKGTTLAVVVLVCMVAVWLAAVSGAVYVAGHFIAKVW